MSYVRTSGTPQVFQHQQDAYLSQANPVSAQKYTVLDTTNNVRLISIAAKITWATTQPTPLRVYVTIDGQTFTFEKANPVSGTTYYAFLYAGNSNDYQPLGTDDQTGRPFMLEGRSVKVEVQITWATTQPTPLECRVRYAKIP
jgi:hypothetical protein